MIITQLEILDVDSKNVDLGHIEMRHNDASPLQGGTIWINVTSSLVNGALVNRWQYPCIKNIKCTLVSEDSVSILGSIILSSVFIFLTITLMICLKFCHWKAARNDKLQVSEVEKTSYLIVIVKLLVKKKRALRNGKTSQVVETVPAAGQHCRYNLG